MGDPLQKVQAGQRLKIPAETFNTFIDAARDFRARQHDRGAASQASRPDGCVVLCKNSTGGNRARGEIVGLNSPLSDPQSGGTAESEFLAHRAMVGIAIDGRHYQRIGVCLEPIATGTIGRVAVSGVWPALVEVQNTSDTFAETVASTFTLRSCSHYGGVELINYATAISQQWCLVRLGSGAPVLRFVLKEAFYDDDSSSDALTYKPPGLAWSEFGRAKAYALDCYYGSTESYDTEREIDVWCRLPGHRFSRAGSAGYAVWCADSRRYEAVSLANGAIYARVQAGHTNSSGSGYKTVSVKFSPQYGPGDTGDAFTAVVMVPSGQAIALYPDDIVALAEGAHAMPPGWPFSEVMHVRQPVVISPCCGPPIGTISIWNSSSNIPTGWSICDGTNGTVDLRGRFVMGKGTESGESNVGDTGGYRRHGGDENDHADHAAHSHGGTTGAGSSHSHGLSGQWSHVAAGSDAWIPFATDAESAHTHAIPEQAAMEHGDTDNRPRYYVLAYIQRTS